MGLLAGFLMAFCCIASFLLYKTYRFKCDLVLKVQKLQTELNTLQELKAHKDQFIEFKKLQNDLSSLGAGLMEIRRVNPDDVFLRGE